MHGSPVRIVSAPAESFRVVGGASAGADTLVMISVLQSVRDVPRTLQAAYNAIRPGGWLVFSDRGPRPSATRAPHSLSLVPLRHTSHARLASLHLSLSHILLLSARGACTPLQSLTLVGTPTVPAESVRPPFGMWAIPAPSSRP